MARMWFASWVVAALVASSLSPSSARPTPDTALRGNRLLLVLPQESAYASIITDLKSEGFYLTIKTSRSRDFPLFEFGAPLYDGVFFVDYLPEQSGAGLDAHDLIRYVNAGGNLVITGTAEGSNLLRDVAAQSGFEMDLRTSTVIDHFHPAPSSNPDHSLVETTEVISSPAIFPEPITKPVLYKGPGHVLTGNPLTFSLLRASSTAYTSKATGGSGVPFALGKSISLVSALQARCNSRLVVAGSVSLFTDPLVHGKTSAKYNGNREFARGVLRWAFQQTGVLRITSTDHHRVNQTRSEYYRVKDDMVYSVHIEELKNDKWVPFKADDVQMEATMLDPYLRVPFKHDNKGNFNAHFRLPDVHGMYTLHLAYSRKGFAHLEAADIISVRPFRHNEYERFIPAAYPYYTSAFSMMAGVLLFSFVFLYYRDPAPVDRAATGPATPKKTQ